MTNLVMSPDECDKRRWDWTGLNRSFARDIRVGDIDGFVEVGNRFLFIEGKPTDKSVSAGQLIAFTRLASLPMVTFIVLRGNPPGDVTGWEVIGKEKYDGDYAAFATFVNKWFLWADSNPLL